MDFDATVSERFRYHKETHKQKLCRRDGAETLDLYRNT